MYGRGTSGLVRKGMFGTKLAGKISKAIGIADFDNHQDELTGTAIHEMAHAVFANDTNRFTDSHEQYKQRASDTRRNREHAVIQLKDKSLLLKLKESKSLSVSKERLEELQTTMIAKLQDEKVDSIENGLRTVPYLMEPKMKGDEVTIFRLAKEEIFSELSGLKPTELSSTSAILPGYWKDRDTKSGAKGAEQPVTSYGKTNAAEDLCESVMFYYKRTSDLRSKAPQRFDLVEQMVKEKGLNTKK
jgi:hypothetical protein